MLAAREGLIFVFGCGAGVCASLCWVVVHSALDRHFERRTAAYVARIRARALARLREAQGAS